MERAEAMRILQAAGVTEVTADSRLDQAVIAAGSELHAGPHRVRWDRAAGFTVSLAPAAGSTALVLLVNGAVLRLPPGALASTESGPGGCSAEDPVTGSACTAAPHEPGTAHFARYADGPVHLIWTDSGRPPASGAVSPVRGYLQALAASLNAAMGEAWGGADVIQHLTSEMERHGIDIDLGLE